MYDIRNSKFEVTVQAWRCLVVLSFMADKRKYMLFLRLHAQEPAKNGMRNVLGQVSLHHGNGFKYYVCVVTLYMLC